MTVDINFYALSFSTLPKVLPKLLEKVYGTGRRAVILFDDKEYMEAINSTLWTYSTMAFLPHASANDGMEASRQPIWLTTKLENPNQAEVLVVTTGEIIDFSQGENKFNKCLDFFNANDKTSLEDARKRFSAYKSQGLPCYYYKQDDKGGWLKA